MPDPAALTDEQRTEVVALLLQGQSQGSIARKFGCSQQTISRLAQQEGISSVNQALNKVIEAKRNYNLATRLQLLNKAFDKAEELLDRSDLTPSHFQSLVMSIAILTDKRRLEDSSSPESEDSHDTDDAIAELERRLEDLARRKRLN